MEPRSPQSFHSQAHSYAYYAQTALQRFSLPQLRKTTALSFILEQLFLVPNLRMESSRQREDPKEGRSSL